VFKGYFGIGAVLDAPLNRNAIVIPGIVFRAPDLLFGVIMRAVEYTRRKAKDTSDKPTDGEPDR
jgi:hypothetical protein